MPKRPCAEPRCADFASYRGRCQRHAKQREKQTHPNKAFYNTKRWRLTRRHQLYNYPLCAVCDRLATDVDHIVPIAEGGDKWSSENLASMCRRCHSKKTRGEQLSLVGKKR